MHTSSIACISSRLLLAFALLGGVGGTLRAQETNAPADEVVATPTFGRVKNFSVPDYYEPPNQNQMRRLLRGVEAEPQPDGGVLIQGLHAETYTPDGKIQMTIKAPRCLYNTVDQTASSASRIEARSGDGKLFIEGEGFRWQQTNATFTISNRVHTIYQQPILTVTKP